MFGISVLAAFEKLDTPFYFYDIDVLRQSIHAAKTAAVTAGFKIHYALKANVERRVLAEMLSANFGADCVSGGEVRRAIECGFSSDEIVFAGVGKSDREIEQALAADIFCFNCESPGEIEVINQLAGSTGKKARIALRINPDVDAHTHHYITTGKEENKFGINRSDIPDILASLPSWENIQLVGIHFHIGSQITDLAVYQRLAQRVNEIQSAFRQQGIVLEHVNLGGGLGIDYHHPEKNAVPDFSGYFGVLSKGLELQPQQTAHVELGRALVGQCGSLITRVLYVKSGRQKTFAIVDAGMTELIRPSLYQAYHHIDNLSSSGTPQTYDIVGPICESSDFFSKDFTLPETHRGDILAIRSAGAYGAVMASHYNLRETAPAIFSDALPLASKP